MRKLNWQFLMATLCLSLVWSHCSRSAEEEKQCWSTTDDYQLPEGETDSLNVAIYLDATLSMQGFANTERINTFQRFLSDLEGGVISGWRRAKTNFFNFGDDVYRINREEFLLGRYVNFYRARTGYLQTKIDRVISTIRQDRLNIIITDLFQDSGDVNAISKKIKENCYASGLSVSIICIPSYFNGTIYDVPTSSGYTTHYSYQSQFENAYSYKPFFVFVIGAASNIYEFVDLIKNKCDYLTDNNIIVFSDAFVSNVKVLEFSFDPKEFQQLKRLEKEFKNTRTIRFRAEKHGTFEIPFSINRYPYTIDFEFEELDVRVVGKKKNEPDSLARRVKVEQSGIKKISENEFLVYITLEKPKTKAIYCYKLIVEIPRSGALSIPTFFKTWATQNPSVNNDPNKTLGLDILIDNLAASFLASKKDNLPRIATAYLNIQVR
jgi:hypothetical protein